MSDRQTNRQTCEESTGILQVNAIIPPLPLALADLADDEENDSKRSTYERQSHQEAEPVDQTLQQRNSGVRTSPAPSDDCNVDNHARQGLLQTGLGSNFFLILPQKSRFHFPNCLLKNLNLALESHKSIKLKNKTRQSVQCLLTTESKFHILAVNSPNSMTSEPT